MVAPDAICETVGCGHAAQVLRKCAKHALADYFRTTVQPRRMVAGWDELPACAHADCPRKVATTGDLCGPHRKQMGRKGYTATIAVRRKAGAALVRDIAGRKQCGRCLSWLPLTDYDRSPVQHDGLQPSCWRCRVTATYSLTADDLDALLAAQGGVCAVCNQHDRSGKRLAIDHDHACCRGWRSCGKCVRGALCSRCNSGLGRMKDSPARLRAAAAYLDAWNGRRREVPERSSNGARGTRADRLWLAYRLSVEEYDAMLAKQDGGCAICATAPSAARRLAVDHDHACCPEAGRSCGRCLRALLCTQCNVGIGHFDERPEILRRAAQYLETPVFAGHMISPR
jgi:hypothetical protein